MARLSCGAHDELMQVRVLPPHDDLEHPMQPKERHLTGANQASPDRWFNVSKANMELVDNLVCELSHWRNLLLSPSEPGETYNW